MSDGSAPADPTGGGGQPVLERYAFERSAIDLVVFDKDGTLIDFDAMWAGWAVGLASGLEEALGRPLRDELYVALAFDAAAGHATAGGLLAASPMAVIREAVGDFLRHLPGVDAAAAARALDRAWTPPDPVALAAPLTDLVALLGGLGASGFRVAVATSDDRAPTVATLDALGLTPLIDAVVCADDGHAVKPLPGALHAICAELGVAESRSAMVGDSPADLQAGRAAGFALSVGVLSGVGSVDDLGPFADVLLPSIDAIAR